MTINEREVEAAGLDLKAITSIARRISRAAKEAQGMGVLVFGGGCGYPGTWQLRFRDDDDKGSLILANLDGNFDGGDGGNEYHGDGLERGER